MSGVFPWIAVGFAAGYYIGLFFAKNYWTLAKRERASSTELRAAAESRVKVAEEVERRIGEMVNESERRAEELLRGLDR